MFPVCRADPGEGLPVDRAPRRLLQLRRQDRRQAAHVPGRRLPSRLHHLARGGPLPPTVSNREQVMHALGFEHEHQRPDRDQWIRVEYRNVQPGQMVNFEKILPYEVDYPDLYDYKSSKLCAPAYSKRSSYALRRLRLREDRGRPPAGHHGPPQDGHLAGGQHAAEQGRHRETEPAGQVWEQPDGRGRVQGPPGR